MKTCIFAAGRFNPPNKGHSELFNTVKQQVKLHQAMHFVGVSDAYNKNNPIEPAKKVSYLQKIFPEINFLLLNKDNPTYFHLINEIFKQGIDHLVVVVGSDRKQNFLSQLRSLNGHKNLFNFKKISMITQHRAKNLQGEFYISSSQLRKHVNNNNFEKFFSLVPPEMDKNLAEEIFNIIRHQWVN